MSLGLSRSYGSINERAPHFFVVQGIVPLKSWQEQLRALLCHMMTKHGFCVLIGILIMDAGIWAQSVDYSVVSVREESGTSFTKVTVDNDQVCMPLVHRNRNGVNWYTNRIIDISVDGGSVAYLAYKNNASDVFIKSIDRQGGSIQRTNRGTIIDFSYSPDGKYIVFSGQSGNGYAIFQTDAMNGFICRQITNGSQDYSPVYSKDMTKIFFTRMDASNGFIWSFDTQKNFLASYTLGQNLTIESEHSVLCARVNNDKGEIWRIDIDLGTEECIASSNEHSFSTPQLSPAGDWILFTGSSSLAYGKKKYYNTDIFVCRKDGTELTQLTFHAADDLSPVWSRDGKAIFFVSQRGSADAAANVWKMSFNM